MREAKALQTRDQFLRFHHQAPTSSDAKTASAIRAVGVFAGACTKLLIIGVQLARHYTACRAPWEVEIP